MYMYIYDMRSCIRSSAYRSTMTEVRIVVTLGGKGEGVWKRLLRRWDILYLDAVIADIEHSVPLSFVKFTVCELCISQEERKQEYLPLLYNQTLMYDKWETCVSTCACVYTCVHELLFVCTRVCLHVYMCMCNALTWQRRKDQVPALLLWNVLGVGCWVEPKFALLINSLFVWSLWPVAWLLEHTVWLLSNS